MYRVFGRKSRRYNRCNTRTRVKRSVIYLEVKRLTPWMACSRAMQELLPRPRYFIGSRVLIITGINSQLACEETVTSTKLTDAQAPPKPTHFVQITDLPVNERNVVDTSIHYRTLFHLSNSI